MKKISTILILTMISFGISYGQNKGDIKFTHAKNYFVKNSYKEGELRQYKILSQKEFDEIFGMACLMGNEGKPTTIDFKKQFVFAIICPETTISDELIPVNLKKENKNKLSFNYKTKIGSEQSYTSRPCIIIVIDKKYKNCEIAIKNQIVK